MKQSKATDLLMERYGLIKGARLVQYAAMLQGMGEVGFDKVMSQQLRSKVTREMVAVGVYWDDVQWDPGIERWYVGMARRWMKQVRRTA